MRKHFARIVMMAAFFIAGLFPLVTSGATAMHVVISQVQVAGAIANDEWVELYNPGEHMVDLSSFSIQYKSATGSTFLKKNLSSGTSIQAHGYYLVGHSDYQGTVTADMSQTTFALSGAGGNIFLVSAQTLLTNAADANIIDALGYGTGNAPEGSAAPAPAANQSLRRKPASTNGAGQDTDNNAQDFQVQSPAQAHNSHSAAEPTLVNAPVATPTSSTDTSLTTTSASSSDTSLSSNTNSASNSSATSSSSPSESPRVLINEILPNPTTDSNEAVELYSSSSGDVDLSGWTLSDGTGVIANLNGTLKNHFFVYTLSSSHLNNAGDRVILNDQHAALIDSVTYGTFADGNSLDNAPSVNQNQTLVRSPDGRDSDVDSIDWFVSTAITLGRANILTPPLSAPSTSAPVSSPSLAPSGASVVINEFVADPTDEEVEWIELYNLGDISVNLTGWNIEEGSGARTPLSGSIGSNTNDRYALIEKPHGSLNNAGDLILLVNPGNTIVDRVAYGEWNDGDAKRHAPSTTNPWSVARLVDGITSGNPAKDFAVTTTPTKLRANTIKAPSVSAATSTNSTKSSTPSIVFSELLPNPTGVDFSQEWIELANTGPAPVDISGWSIETDDDQHCELPKSMEPLRPQAMLVLRFPVLCFPLSNTATTMRLVRTTDGTLIDHVRYSATQEGASWINTPTRGWQWSSTPTPGTSNIFTALNLPPVIHIDYPETLATGTPLLFDASDSYDPNNDPLNFQWDFGDGQHASERSPLHTYSRGGNFTISLALGDGRNSVKTSKRLAVAGETANPVVFALSQAAAKTNDDNTSIRLSELLPNPNGADSQEWIELENTSSELHNLGGWSIAINNRRAKLPQSTLINPHSFLLLPRTQTKLALLNTKATVQLFNTATLVDSTSYANLPEGVAWARAATGWQGTIALTPGADNIIRNSVPQREATSTVSSSANTPVSLTNTEDVSELSNGTLVNLSGVVVVAPGVISVRDITLNTSALVVRLPTTHPVVKQGDRIQLTGRLSGTDARRIVTIRQHDTLTILAHNQTVTPTPLSIAQAKTDDAPSFVQIQGTIREAHTRSWLVEDSDDELTIQIPPKTPAGLEGSTMRITGVLQHTSSGIKLFARNPDDITIVSAPAQRTEVKSTYTPFSSLFLVIAGILAALLAFAMIPGRGIAPLPQLEPIAEPYKLSPQGDLIIHSELDPPTS